MSMGLHAGLSRDEEVSQPWNTVWRKVMLLVSEFEKSALLILATCGRLKDKE